MCISLYSWYKLPPSVHKILTHGSEIIKTLDVPFGWLNEEPQEANNKIFRKTRNNNCRMNNNRKSTNVYILHHLLVGSNPPKSSTRLKEK